MTANADRGGERDIDRATVHHDVYAFMVWFRAEVNAVLVKHLLGVAIIGGIALAIAKLT